MVPNYLSSLQQKSHHLKLGPSHWTVWTSDMMAMFGQKFKPPTLQTTLVLHFIHLLVLAHLQCQNPSFDYLQRAHCTFMVNNTKFEGFTKDPFPLSGIVPSGSTLVCKICKEPPKCIALWEAKIFYVHGKESFQRACFYIDTHQHLVKVGDCMDSRKRINALIKKLV